MTVFAANTQIFRWTTIVLFSAVLLAVGVVHRCTAEEPIATIAVVSNPYITKLPPDQIKDENGSVREFLAKTVPESMEKTVALVNKLKPDALVVSGSLTWSGSSEDFAAVNRYLDLANVPTFVTPGHRDRLADSMDEFRRVFAKFDAENSVKSVKGVALAFAGDLDRDPDAATARLEKYTGSKPRQLIEHRDCAFITVPFLTTRADEEQIGFLRDQLARTGEKRHVFVVAHYPSLPAFGNNLQPQLGGTEVLSLLHEHRVTGYLFGHRHRNGFRRHERTAHVLTDNMTTIHLLHVFPDRIIVGRKRVGAPLYEKLVIPSPRS